MNNLIISQKRIYERPLLKFQKHFHEKAELKEKRIKYVQHLKLTIYICFKLKLYICIKKSIDIDIIRYYNI